jgi:hypothetical protein
VQTAVRTLGGNFSSATVIGQRGGAYTVKMGGGPLDLDVGTNSLTGGVSPSMSVTTRDANAGIGTKWYEEEAIVEWLDSRGMLAAWGTPNQPCGYDPYRKTGETGATAQPITGLFVETAGFNYETGSEPVLYLYVWQDRSGNYLLPGRILRNQRTTDF